MIAKRPKVRQAKEGGGRLGGMKGLVRYVSRLSAHGVEPLTDALTITNSSAVTIEDFIAQVELVQRRSKSDQNKVYHLVVSFPPGEHPSPPVLADIEQRLCESINAGDHQRLSVLHEDTDCLHLHVAINRVNPTTFKLNSIHKDYAARQACCEQLEIKHGLVRTSHEMRLSEGEGRARSVALHHGETPLLERAQALAPGLLAARSWAEIHDQLGREGLTLRQRGAGLVVVEGDVGVKASNVAKDLSLRKLQARLGPFQPGSETTDAGVRRQSESEQGREGGRGRGRSESYRELRRQFDSERAATLAERQATWGLVRQARATAMQAVRGAAGERHARLETIAPGPARWALSAAVRQEQGSQFAQAREEAKERAAQARRGLAGRPPTSWIDWLRARAAAGDGEALAALRHAGVAGPPADGSWIAGTGPAAIGEAAGCMEDANASDQAKAPWNERLRHVSRRGVVTYEVGRTRVRDDGDRLHLNGQPSNEAIAVALQLAKERHGTRLNVQGDVALRSRIAHVAAQLDPGIRFDDAQTERLRAASVLVREERRNGEPRGRGPGEAGQAGPEVPRRPGRSRVGAVRPQQGSRGQRETAYSPLDADRALLAAVRGRYAAGGIRAPVGLGSQPNLAASAAQPAAGDRTAWPGRRLRDLPRLDLVRGPEHGQVSLPAPDGSDLGNRTTDGDLTVRRPGTGDRAGSAAAAPRAGGGELTPVEQYVAERNATRLRVSGLEPHRPFEPVDGPLTYAGRRVVDGQPLALLRSGDEILVMEVHPDQQARISRFRTGQTIEVLEGRIVRPKSANTAQHQDNTAINERGGRKSKSRPTR